MSKLEVTNFLELRNQIQVIAIQEINKIVKKRLLGKIEQEIIDAAIKRFRNLSIFRGLNGQYPDDEDKDYQAIFGLTDDVAHDALHEMIKIIRYLTKVKLQITESENTVLYQVIISFANLNKAFIQMSSGRYSYNYKSISFHKGKTKYNNEITLEIPWMDWFIYGTGEVHGRVSFDLTPSDQLSSRSGRAVMRRSGVDWDWDGIDIADRIFRSEKFKEKVISIIGENVKDIVGNLVGKI